MRCMVILAALAVTVLIPSTVVAQEGPDKLEEMYKQKRAELEKRFRSQMHELERWFEKRMHEFRKDRHRDEGEREHKEKKRYEKERKYGEREREKAEKLLRFYDRIQAIEVIFDHEADQSSGS